MNEADEEYNAKIYPNNIVRIADEVRSRVQPSSPSLDILVFFLVYP